MNDPVKAVAEALKSELTRFFYKVEEAPFQGEGMVYINGALVPTLALAQAAIAALSALGDGKMDHIADAGKMGAVASPPVQDGWKLDQVLAIYEAETNALPLGHEIPSRGWSTYNWQKAAIADMRRIAASPVPEGEK